MGTVCCRNSLEHIECEEHTLISERNEKERSNSEGKPPGSDQVEESLAPNGTKPVQAPLPEVATKTLGTAGLDGDAAERQKAYLKRKEARSKKRNEKQFAGQDPSAMLLKDGFLSNVPEVDTDIAYRYAFIVMGYATAKAVETACLSEVARGLPHAANADIVRAKDEPVEGAPDSPRERSQLLETAEATGAAYTSKVSKVAAKASRCLCPVPYPTGRADPNARLTLAKLVFSAYGYQQEPPECYSRLEASTCAAIFILVVDPENSQDPMDPFSEQMWAVERAVQAMRFKSRPEFRPVRAILLCRVGDKEPKDSWREQLDDFEQMNGQLWKFGLDRPISLTDGNELHAVFAQIASSRILRNGDDGDSDRSAEENMPLWATENTDKDDIEDMPSSTKSNASGGRKLMKALVGR
mmetsp:Transcript_104416/g.164875  ORF Transcript_104416/g.164875 Transcript_104416/m.164875 type:complete len:411 (+) Transcript_104416:1-1233(+)